MDGFPWYLSTYLSYCKFRLFFRPRLHKNGFDLAGYCSNNPCDFDLRFLKLYRTGFYWCMPSYRIAFLL